MPPLLQNRSCACELVLGACAEQRRDQVRGKFANIKLQLRTLVFDDFARFGREGDEVRRFLIMLRRQLAPPGSTPAAPPLHCSILMSCALSA